MAKTISVYLIFREFADIYFYGFSKKKSYFRGYIISGPTSEDWCHFISNSLYILNQILNNEANTYSILFCHLFSPC